MSVAKGENKAEDLHQGRNPIAQTGRSTTHYFALKVACGICIACTYIIYWMNIICYSVKVAIEIAIRRVFLPLWISCVVCVLCGIWDHMICFLRSVSCIAGWGRGWSLGFEGFIMGIPRVSTILRRTIVYWLYFISRVLFLACFGLSSEMPKSDIWFRVDLLDFDKNQKYMFYVCIVLCVQSLSVLQCLHVEFLWTNSAFFSSISRRLELHTSDIFVACSLYVCMSFHA